MAEISNPIASEEIEPFAALIIGRMYARCEVEKSKGETYHEDALRNFWYTLHGLEKIAVGIRTATHFSIAMNNQIRMVAHYIKSSIGVDPMTAPGWAWR
jgi:hypothetical protein